MEHVFKTALIGLAVDDKPADHFHAGGSMEQQAEKKDIDVQAAAPQRGNAWARWPTGLIAIAVLGIAWLGIYLMWRGIAPFFGL